MSNTKYYEFYGLTHDPFPKNAIDLEKYVKDFSTEIKRLLEDQENNRRLEEYENRQKEEAEKRKKREELPRGGLNSKVYRGSEAVHQGIKHD